MGDLLKIAFRNVFRNSRRSLLTIIISFLAVAVLMVSSSFLGGFFDGILGESIKSTGHIRITSPDYDLKERMMSLTGNVPKYGRFKKTLAKVPGVVSVAGRIKFPCLVFQGNQSKEGLGYGIEPDDLRNLNFKSYTYQGRLLDPASKNEIMAGRDLAKSLHLQTGVEVTLLVRTLYNSTYALNYRVVGLFDMQNGQLNKGFYISLASAQELLDMNDKATEIIMFGKSSSETDRLIKGLKKVAELKGFMMKSWNQIGLAPIFTEVVTIISTIMQLIFALLAALGIANTMMMAVLERRAEIGLLKSMGMYEDEITVLFTIEGFILGLAGTCLGLIFGGVIAYLLSKYGLNLGGSLQGLPLVVTNMIYGVFNFGIFLKSIILGLTAAILAALIPAMKGVRLKPTEALRKD